MCKYPNCGLSCLRPNTRNPNMAWGQRAPYQILHSGRRGLGCRQTRPGGKLGELAVWAVKSENWPPGRLGKAASARVLKLEKWPRTNPENCNERFRKIAANKSEKSPRTVLDNSSRPELFGEPRRAEYIRYVLMQNSSGIAQGRIAQKSPRTIPDKTAVKFASNSRRDLGQVRERFQTSLLKSATKSRGNSGQACRRPPSPLGTDLLARASTAGKDWAEAKAIPTARTRPAARTNPASGASLPGRTSPIAKAYPAARASPIARTSLAANDSLRYVMDKQ